MLTECSHNRVERELHPEARDLFPCHNWILLGKRLPLSPSLGLSLFICEIMVGVRNLEEPFNIWHSKTPLPDKNTSNLHCPCFKPTTILWGRYCHPHFADEETEILKRWLSLLSEWVGYKNLLSWFIVLSKRREYHLLCWGSFFSFMHETLCS